MNTVVYKGISGNLRPICAVLTHEVCKLLILLRKTDFQNSQKRLRLPLVDSIGLSSFFMVKIEHYQVKKQEVAEIHVLNHSNKRT